MSTTVDANKARMLATVEATGTAVDLIVNQSKLLTMAGAMKAISRGVHTEHIRPPIPCNAFDWAAWFDDYDGAPDAGYQPTGSGKTEAEAIFELLVAYTADSLV